VHASWPVAVAEPLGRPWRRTDRWAGAWIGDSGTLTNPVVLTAPLDATGAGQVAAEIAEVVPATVPYFLLNPWLSPDVRPHGLALLGHPPLMLRLPTPRDGGDPEGVEVREVRDGEPASVAAAHLAAEATLVEYVAALGRARGRGAGAAVTWAATLADPSRPAVLVASDDGRGDRSLPLSTYSPVGGLRQDPGQAAESSAVAETYGGTVTL